MAMQPRLGGLEATAAGVARRAGVFDPHNHGQNPSQSYRLWPLWPSGTAGAYSWALIRSNLLLAAARYGDHCICVRLGFCVASCLMKRVFVFRMRFLLAASLFAQLASVAAFAPSCSTLSLRHHVGNGPISLRAPFARNDFVKSSASHRSRLVQSGIQSIKASGLTEVMMPALSSTMKEGKIVQWTKTVGDR
jgi:hypothetical protein